MDPRAGPLLARARWTVHPEPFAIVGLPAAGPAADLGTGVLAVVRDGGEVTHYLPESSWDRAAARHPGARASRGWRVLTLESEVPWDVHGVLAALTGALAAHAIPCAALSTFRTDHLLVPGPRLDEALAALRGLA